MVEEPNKNEPAILVQIVSHFLFTNLIFSLRICEERRIPCVHQYFQMTAQCRTSPIDNENYTSATPISIPLDAHHPDYSIVLRSLILQDRTTNPSRRLATGRYHRVYRTAPFGPPSVPLESHNCPSPTRAFRKLALSLGPISPRNSCSESRILCSCSSCVLVLPSSRAHCRAMGSRRWEDNDCPRDVIPMIPPLFDVDSSSSTSRDRIMSAPGVTSST